MNDQLRITIEGEPYGKGRPKHRMIMMDGKAIVQVYTPKETVDHEKVIAQIARYTMGARQPFSGALQLEVMAVYPVPASWSNKARVDAMEGLTHCMAKPDLDNVVKLVLDALNKIAYKDDVQIVRVNARKKYGRNPRVEVLIKPA
jgi:Holliday junction resolvase RusA-like endonuclease